MSHYYTCTHPSDIIGSYSLEFHRLHHYQQQHHHYQQLNRNHLDKFHSEPSFLLANPNSMQSSRPGSPQDIPSPASSNTRTKAKRAQVKNACTNCKRMCKKCDDSRPCSRCIKHGVADSCVSSERKPRVRGILRGPYKKRAKNTCPSCSSTRTSQSLPPFSTILAALPTPQNSNSGSSNSDNTCSPCNSSSHNDVSFSQNTSSNSNGSLSGSTSISDFSNHDHFLINHIHKLDAPTPTELDPNSCQMSASQAQGNCYTLPWILNPHQRSGDVSFTVPRGSDRSGQLMIKADKTNGHNPINLSMKAPNGNDYSIMNNRFNENSNGNLSSPSRSPEEPRLPSNRNDSFSYAS